MGTFRSAFMGGFGDLFRSAFKSAFLALLFKSRLKSSASHQNSHLVSYLGFVVGLVAGFESMRSTVLLGCFSGVILLVSVFHDEACGYFETFLLVLLVFKQLFICFRSCCILCGKFP